VAEGFVGSHTSGALRVLADEGFEPVGILGTSIGGFVGACRAAGQSVEQMEAAARGVTKERVAEMPKRVLWARGVLSPSLYRGDVLRAFLASILPSGGWEDMDVRFQTNAVELGAGRTEWFGIGARTDVPLVDAVYASMALPLFYPPARLPGGLYVDGGTEDALPIHRAAELGATGIVAVDTGAGPDDRCGGRGRTGHAGHPRARLLDHVGPAPSGDRGRVDRPATRAYPA
jgi:NTE family protein